MSIWYCFRNMINHLIQLSDYLIWWSATQWIQGYVSLILYFDMAYKSFDMAYNCRITYDPQSGEQLINSIKSTCYILMTMMIYCNQWPLLLLNLYWHLAFKYFQLWRILMNTWQVTILILSCISPQSNQSSSSINKLKHFWQMNIMKIHFSTDWNIWKLVPFSNIHTNA